MVAGKLNDLVTFQRLVLGDDGYGNVFKGWDDLFSAWADILEAPGREAIAAGRVEAARSATMRIRRSSASLGLTEADRVLARGRLWNIRSIGDVARARELLELVIEVGAAS